jgi:hypothetical protein
LASKLAQRRRQCPCLLLRPGNQHSAAGKRKIIRHVLSNSPCQVTVSLTARLIETAPVQDEMLVLLAITDNHSLTTHNRLLRLRRVSLSAVHIAQDFGRTA